MSAQHGKLEVVVVLDDVIEDDLIAAVGVIRIDGVVRGDLLAVGAVPE